MKTITKNAKITIRGKVAPYPVRIVDRGDIMLINGWPYDKADLDIDYGRRTIRDERAHWVLVW